MREKPSSTVDNNLVVMAFSGATVEEDKRPYVAVWAQHGDGPVTRVFLPASHATDASKVLSALLDAGLGFNDPLLTKRAVVDALKRVSSQPTRVAVRSGWHEKLFVYDGNIFGQNAEPYLFAHQDLPHKTGLASPACNDELIEFLDKVGPRSDFIVCATLIAFAQPLLGMLPSPERAVVYIWGESRTGKTTLATLINALSRPPSDRSLFSFDSTERAFEEMLQHCSDNVAVFDEFRVVQDAERGGSVCLNSFGRFAKWISASIMPPPSLVSAR